MPLPRPSKRAYSLACASVTALALAACGSTVSTSAFKGEEHEVAQGIANLQADATAAEEGKICQNDLAASVVERLKGRKACEQAIKEQLTEIDNLELSVHSIKIDAAAKTATATVKSTYAGSPKQSTITLAKEGGRWKITGLG